MLWRYARCWWHFTLHIINVEKNVSRLLFHVFPFLIWVWLGWRCGGCALMYCSSFRNFTFCFYWFLFYFRVLVYICVIGVFLYGVCFNVCLFAYLFCCFISFLFPFCMYLLFMLCDCTVSIFLWKYSVALKWDYHILYVYWLIVYVVFLKMYRNIVCIIQWNYN